MKLVELLKFAVINQASDLHISSGLTPVIRINGEINKINLTPLSHEQAKELLYSVMQQSDILKLEQQWATDFAVEITNLARFRFNVFYQQRGISAAIRIINNEIINLNQFPAIFKTIANYNSGLILVTGVSGAGKTNTLAAMIDFINQNYYQHIITIEDPIEFVYSSKRSLIDQRELNVHTKSFNHALRAALRQDPNIILVGELRDLETIRLALTAAETGHLVFSTIHTASAAKTINRIIDVFNADEKNLLRLILAETLSAVISQTLVKKIDNSGRVAAFEIMIVNHAIRNLIRENKITQINSLIQTGEQYGMCTLDQFLYQLLLANQISLEQAKLHAQQEEFFRNIL